MPYEANLNLNLHINSAVLLLPTAVTATSASGDLFLDLLSQNAPLPSDWKPLIHQDAVWPLNPPVSWFCLLQTPIPEGLWVFMKIVLVRVMPELLSGAVS